MNAEIRRYQLLLNHLNSLAPTLQSSIQSLESAVSYSKISINIGNTNYKRIELENMLEDLKTEYANLVNVYIPEVKRKTNELIVEQNRLEEERRQAEEKKKAQQRARKND